ncbi:MAG: LCP family protein [Atopobiaceae bacterium]|jgi:LCP family protein required for cell wall assembly
MSDKKEYRHTYPQGQGSEHLTPGTYNPYDDADPYDPFEDDFEDSFFEDEPQDVLDFAASRRENRPTHAQQPNASAQSPQNLGGGARISRRNGLERAMDRISRGPSRPRASRGVSSYDELRHEVRRPRTRRAHRGHGGWVVLGGIVAALVVIYLLVFSPIDRQLAFEPAESQAISHELSWNIPTTPYYVLALGSDAREGDAVSRTDTMILMRIDPIASKVTMVSIPRDTKVEIEGYGTQKINAAYAFGGTAGAIDAVHKLVGVPISHVGVVYFDGISGLVDALGGVTVDVPVDINDPTYTGLVMSAGTYEMDGETALLFSRVRHGFANGDFQRQADQRILIEAIMNKMLASGPQGIMALTSDIGSLAHTDMKCYNLIPLMLRFMLTKPTIYSCSIPSSTAMIDGVSYVIADEDALSTMMAKVDAGIDPNSDYQSAYGS